MSRRTATSGPAGRVPELFELCLCCYRHVRPATRACPHCGAGVQQLLAAEALQLEKVARLTAALQALVAGAGETARPGRGEARGGHRAVASAPRKVARRHSAKRN